MEQPELHPHSKLDTGQRIGVALLICITALVILVTFLQFKSHLFSYGVRGKSDPLAALDPSAKAEKQEDALKHVDTDGDGLTDYDELFVYHSSPYLRDTDSDGVADGDEVRRGSSPTCPEGKDCLFNPIVAQANASSTPATLTTKPTNSGSKPSMDLSKLSPEDLRTALIESGVPEAQLVGVSNEDLIKIILQAQQEQQVPAAATSPNPAQPASPTP